MPLGDVPELKPTRGFLSYRRADNEDFRGVADQIRRDITSMYEATTGKSLEIFIDRESIGWGEDWRQKIQDSVRSTTVFMPLITMRYFTSQACIEELFAFHAAAEHLGVTELLLPIVLFGAGNLRTDDPRREISLIASLNYKNIEQAWQDGYDSPSWIGVMRSCVSELDRALTRAEDVLAEDESLSATPPGGPLPIERTSPTDDEVEVDLLAITQRFDTVRELTEKATQSVADLGNQAEAMLNGQDLGAMSQKQMNAVFLRGASLMADPAGRLQRDAGQLEQEMDALDVEIRALVQQLGGMSIDEARQQLDALISGFAQSDMDATLAQVNQLIEQLTFSSLMSMSLRKSLRPAIIGLRSMQRVIRTFASWKNL